MTRRPLGVPVRKFSEIFVLSAQSSPTDSTHTTDEGSPYCERPSDSFADFAHSVSTGANFTLPKWHPGRETGPQSHGSPVDGRAPEEAPRRISRKCGSRG